MVSVKVPIKVERRSGFTWSHHRGFSQKIGEIIPLAVNEVIPNSKHFMRYALAGSMAPLASDAYMKCYYDVRAFFVPARLLYGGWESWFSDYPYNTLVNGSGGNIVAQQKANLPYFQFDYSDTYVFDFVKPCSLADYLGLSIDVSDMVSGADQDFMLSAMPFLAYHKICDDWFRQPNISTSCFARPSGYYTQIPGTSDYFVAAAPFISCVPGAEIISVTSSGSVPSTNCLFADGHSVFETRFANFDYDYFTNALPSKQLGTAFSVSTSGNSFSIEALRAANSLQQFAELNQLAGSNEVSVVRARYGANLADGVAQRSIYLGGARIDIATKAVDVTVSSSAGYTANPMINAPGASGGKVMAQGSDIIIDNFTANEPGYIFVLGVVIPKVTYGSGCRRYLRHYIGGGSIVDMANPLLQNIGNQPIFQYELNGGLIANSSDENAVFGYTDRYAEFMTMEDSVAGLLRAGESLSSFMAQRNFHGANPQISTNFLQVPATALNNIAAVSGDVSKYGFFGQAAFDWRVSQPLAQYSLPSLQNPAYEHGKTVMVHRGGFRF